MKYAIIKIALLGMFFVLAHAHLPVGTGASMFNGGFFWFSLIWSFTLVSVCLSAFHPNTLLRFTLAVILTVSAGNALSYWHITGFSLNAIEVERLFQDIAFIDETFEFYGELILKGTLVTAPLFIAFVLPTPPVRSRFRFAILCAPLLILVPIFGVAKVVYHDGGGDSDNLPLPISPLGFVSVLVFDDLYNNPEVQREPIQATTGDSGLQKIVVVMDESVRGDWLDLNVPNGIPSGLLPYLSHGANFGIAASYANCSAASNLSFRYIVRRENYLEDIQRRPSIWAMAKHAGYKTVYVDGQRTNRELQNFMTAQELSEIDELIQHDDNTTAVNKDMMLVEMLQKVLSRNEKLFIYVNKNGVHFPYESKYPPEATVYTPHMEGKGINVNEGNMYGDGFGNVAFRNSYKNAVAWNTGEFFRRLMPNVDFSNLAMFYSSDHGQNFTKTQQQGFLTHCTTGPAPAAEGSVPLAVFTKQHKWQKRLQDAAAYSAQASHWNLAPTALLMMGYEEAFVTAHYAPTLFAKERGDAAFISTFFVRFGLQPVWNKPVTPSAD